MGARTPRILIALGSAGLLALGTAGCTASPSPPLENAEPHTDLSIVEQMQIDENGAQVRPTPNAQPADPAGSGNAICPPVSIATMGALNGPDSALGINVTNGAQMAVDKHNAANPGCQVQLKTFDTMGDPQQAVTIAPQIVDDQNVVGLVGPAFSGETDLTGELFNQAGLVAVTASATDRTLSQNGWRTFFRGVANDEVQGTSVANYLRNTLEHRTVCVVDDNTDYGLGLAQVVRENLGPVADPVCNISVTKGDNDFSAIVNQIDSAEPDSVFFSGYYADAALLARQLDERGVATTFVSADGSKTHEFVAQAGNSAKDAILSCQCGPGGGAFAEDYTRQFGMPPGTYSAESYDITTILLQGIDSGATTRPALLEFVHNYSGSGVARDYRWLPNGELTADPSWIYRVQ